MHYTGVTYRPPFEANTLLLQVTTGCTHNKCSFCSMYRGIKFSISPTEEVEEDLAEASAYAPFVRRIFLENGDAFVLPAGRLAELAEMIRGYLPYVETITMYASIRNVMRKTDEELRMLRALGVNELNIGLESGHDGTLALMNKGYTAAEARRELDRLRAAGIDYGLNVILGGAGSGKWEPNVRATAELLNTVKPYLVYVGALHYAPGCPLYDDLLSGAFVENSYGEYLDEEELLLSLLDLEGSRLFGLHPSNIVRIAGRLNSEKEQMILAVREAREQLHPILNQRPIRGSEGTILG